MKSSLSVDYVPMYICICIRAGVSQMIKAEFVFTKTERNNEEIVYFLQNCHFTIQTQYSINISIELRNFKTPSLIRYKYLLILSSIYWNKKKSCGVWLSECTGCCIIQHLCFDNFWTKTSKYVDENIVYVPQLYMFHNCGNVFTNTLKVKKKKNHKASAFMYFW